MDASTTSQPISAEASSGHSHGMLPQIHVINLDRSADRFATFNCRNSHLASVLRFPAVDGALVDREELMRNGVISEDCPYSSGALGCALSHVALWKKAVNEELTLTIFEDDVVCSLHFAEETARLFSTLPEDWDLIKWGANLYQRFSWVDFGFSKAELHFYDSGYGDDLLAFQRSRFSSSAIRLAHSFGNIAYSLSPKGAHKLLDYCLPLRKRLIEFPGVGVVTNDLHIDIAMCGAFPSMQAFICIPPLVIHDDKQLSDREQRDNI